MAHIPEQLVKINKNIQEAETILSDLKKRTKTENVAEQIEHFESMLNKLNGLKESYLQLSAQFEVNSDMKSSLVSVATVLQNNNQGVSSYDSANGVSSNNTGSVYNIRNALSPFDQLEQLKQERDRLKKELQNQQINTHSTQPTSSLEVDVTNSTRSFNSPNTFTDLVSDLHNFTGLDLSFYISILDHHIEIGSKMVDMVDGLTLSDNLEQGICLLKEVIQRLMELRERFQSVQNAQENIGTQIGIDEDLIQREMDTFNSISEDLKVNFATGVKCFKSAMDIIQSYLDPTSQTDDDRAVAIEGFPGLNDKLNDSTSNGSTTMILSNEETVNNVNSKNNNNNSESASEDNNNPSNEEDDNNDGGDEDSDEDSCREKDQDESMEIGVSSTAGAVDSIINDHHNHHVDQEAMHHLRLQTEFEQKEILKLLEEKRIMQKKLADLKRAKEIAKNQALSLAQSGTVFGDFSHFLRSSQCGNLDDADEGLANSQRPESLALRTGTMVNEMGSLLKMLSDIKTDGDDSYQDSPPRKSNSQTPKTVSCNDASNPPLRLPFNCNSMGSYSAHANILLPDLNEKAEELKQKQSQIKKLQEMLDQIKSDSMNLNEEIIRQDSNDDYHSDHSNPREISNNGRPGKGRDSVTFQEPVATFIANEELYENMREVRMRREELRDRSARNSNSDPRSPSGRVIDSGNAPGAPPDAPTRMPVTSHETASQDRTTAATWGSSSAGGDDYEDHSRNNELNRENLRIRSEGGTHVSPLSNTNDERSRVAPIGQSSTFRSKMRDSTYIKNVIDNDFSNLKGQIENIASLCRNMAVEQNRLARDIADLKCGSSPRLTNNGPDLVINTSGASSVPKHGHGSSLLTDDNLQSWANTSSIPIMNSGGVPSMTNINSLPRNIQTTADPSISFGNHIRAPANHIDVNWEEEASIASSNAVQQQKQMSLYYYPPPTPPHLSYQNVMSQQNMLLQNHAMFMKLQMSLIASQLEQQRLCNLALQQQTAMYPQVSGWPVRGLTPPYYPPPGPLAPSSHLSMLPHSLDSLHNNFSAPIDSSIDCSGLYTMMYHPSETSSRDVLTNTSTNQNIVLPNNSTNGNPWKNTFPANRNIHRN